MVDGNGKCDIALCSIPKKVFGVTAEGSKVQKVQPADLSKYLCNSFS